MNKTTIFLGGFTLLCVALVLLPRGCYEHQQSSTVGSKQAFKTAPSSSLLVQTTPPTSAAAAEAKMNLLYLTPISFYGRVVDQDSVPIGGADVEFSANTTPWGNSAKFRTKSDAAGYFEVTGKHGLSLFVSVTKEGYYWVPRAKGKAGSSGDFAYGSSLGDGVHSPTKSSPVIFVLRKAGVVETLIARHEVRIPLAPDGTVNPVSLRQSRGTSHRILLSCRSEAMPESGGAFDWSLEVKIEDGELADRTDDFAFEAPTSGYRAADSIAMSKGLPTEKWKDRVSKNYFIRFNDGTAARASVDFHAGAKPHVWLDSYLNPKPGSRNLETGPPAMPKK